jgi:hypothetical protein
VVVTLALLASVLWPGASVGAEGKQDVFVVNFPDVQRVHGEVGLLRPVDIRQTSFVRFPEIIVPPVAPEATTRLIPAGTLTTEGFPGLVLSLGAQPKGEVLKAGRVGAILVPEEEVLQQVFNEQGVVSFPLEVSASTPAGKPTFVTSRQRRVPTAFPRYRVLLYNTTDRAAAVSLYAQLTN